MQGSVGNDSFAQIGVNLERRSLLRATARASDKQALGGHRWCQVLNPRFSADPLARWPFCFQENVSSGIPHCHYVSNSCSF